MRFTLLSCILAGSAMFVVKPFTVINKTSKNIVIDQCGWSKTDPVGDVLDDVFSVKLTPNEQHCTSEPFHIMRITINGNFHLFRSLKPNTKIVVSEEAHIQFSLDSDSPLQITYVEESSENDTYKVGVLDEV